MVLPHGLLIQSQASYWLDDSGVLRTAVTDIGGAAGSRTLTMLIKSQLYCLTNTPAPKWCSRGDLHSQPPDSRSGASASWATRAYLLRSGGFAIFVDSVMLGLWLVV
jgi:hypothetical protein